MLIGLHLHTLHFNPENLCNNTTGAWIAEADGNGFAGGVLRNSECKVGVWGAWAIRTNTLTIAGIPVRGQLLLGGITGYARGGVVPLALPGACTAGLCLSFLPKAPGSSSGGIHLTFERSIP